MFGYKYIIFVVLLLSSFFYTNVSFAEEPKPISIIPNIETYMWNDTLVIGLQSSVNKAIQSSSKQYGIEYIRITPSTDEIISNTSKQYIPVDFYKMVDNIYYVTLPRPHIGETYHFRVYIFGKDGITRVGYNAFDVVIPEYSNKKSGKISFKQAIQTRSIPNRINTNSLYDTITLPFVWNFSAGIISMSSGAQMSSGILLPPGAQFLTNSLFHWINGPLSFVFQQEYHYINNFIIKKTENVLYDMYLSSAPILPTGSLLSGGSVGGGLPVSSSTSAPVSSSSGTSPSINTGSTNTGSTSTGSTSTGSTSTGSTSTGSTNTGSTNTGSSNTGSSTPPPPPPPTNYTLSVIPTGSGTITSSSVGISCGTSGSSCSTPFLSGSLITLTSVADSGSLFTGWNGACTGTGSCIVNMIQAQTVGATFTVIAAPPPTNYTLSVIPTGSGTISSSPVGISCGTSGSSCSTSFLSGSLITLTPVTDFGYSFIGWNGACTGTGACTVNMISNETISAMFALNSECNDGIDNDGDGLLDWQMDLGCEGVSGASEVASTRSNKNGFTTFDPDATSRIIYVSNSTGNDANDGLTPATAVKTIIKGGSLVRTGFYDFLLLKRGDVWRDQTLGRFISGKDATHPIIIASYGSSTVRPRIENDAYFIDHQGYVRNYIAIIGLEFMGYKGNILDSAFNGEPLAGLRLVGGADGILLEDNKFTYAETTIQSYPDGVNSYKNIEVRRNMVSESYHTGTCNQASRYRPSGIYTHGIEKILFEENIYDHNGWNESITGACSSMYNHNLYIDGNDMTIKDNILSRGSSMAIKTVADYGIQTKRLTIDNNFIHDGEFAVSAGGNSTGKFRYTDVTIKNNVFSEIGKSNNSNRNFSWGVDLQDNDRTLVENNYFLNQPWYSNSFGVWAASPSFRDAIIRNNLFYNINGNAINMAPGPWWSNVTVSNNRFAGSFTWACDIRHTGSTGSIIYANNQYSSNSFCIESAHQRYSTGQVISMGLDTGATTFTGTFVDPTRTLATYAIANGYPTNDTFLKAAVQSQSRFNWNTVFTAKAINRYIKNGFIDSTIGAPLPNSIPGICGTSNSQVVSSMPTTNLCSSGTPSVVDNGIFYTWTCSGSAGEAIMSCSATKEVTIYTLTTSATGGGLITGGSNFESGRTANVIATPFVGYVFSSFSGCTTSSGNTCTVDMTSNKSVSATFIVDPNIPPPPPLGSNECNDGIDNDGDGLIDWQMDLGCESASGSLELAGPRSSKNGFTTFDPDATSRIIYVSNSTGNDANDGLTPATAVKTIVYGATLVREGQYDFLLLKRGDIWRDQPLYRFKGGKDATHPIIIATYGSSTVRPRIELDANFIDHNGYVKNYLAIMGIELYGYKGNLLDPDYNGAPKADLRLIGGGDNILLEDIKFTYGEAVIQSYPGGVNYYRNTEVRRNIVTEAYHIGTCNQSNAFRPSGIYTYYIEKILFEENIYDHNGWNENVPGACASMYNHNFYISGNDMTIKNNIISRGSSMGIKTVSDFVATTYRMVIDNNFIHDGEIGISAGGNSAGNFRYNDVTITNNVFSEIGKSNNSNRNFSWGIELMDIDKSLIENNYFLNQPWYGNSYGIWSSNPSLRDATIRNNLFYNINGNAIAMTPGATWSNINITNNNFAVSNTGACDIRHTGSGSSGSVVYANNQYSSNGFCLGNVRYSTGQMISMGLDAGATTFTGTFVDPTRTLATYAIANGYPTDTAFLEAAVQLQSRLNWNDIFTANMINIYIKNGFTTF